MAAPHHFHPQNIGRSLGRRAGDDRSCDRDDAEQGRDAGWATVQEPGAYPQRDRRRRDDAARSYVFFAMEREWKRLEKNEIPTEKERADAWASRVNVAQSAREVIRMLYDAVG